MYYAFNPCYNDFIIQSFYVALFAKYQRRINMFSRYPIKKQPQKQAAPSITRLLQQHAISSQQTGTVQAPETKSGHTYHLPPLVLTSSAAKSRQAQPKPSAQKLAPTITKLPPLVLKPSATGSSSEVPSSSLSAETDAAHTSTTDEQALLNTLFDKYEMSRLKDYQNKIIRLEPQLKHFQRHPDWEGSNCHGYTFYEDTAHFIEASEFIDEYSESSSKNVVVFLRGNDIAHSGIIEGTHLRHLLIGIGIIRTQIGPTDTLGYDKRFNLPEDLELLMPYQQLLEIRANMSSMMGNALEHNLFTPDELAFLGDTEQEYETIYNKMHDKIDEFLDNEDYTILNYIQSKSEPRILQIYRRIAQLFFFA